jgi:hypothetical protein
MIEPRRFAGWESDRSARTVRFEPNHSIPTEKPHLLEKVPSVCDGGGCNWEVCERPFELVVSLYFIRMKPSKKDVNFAANSKFSADDPHDLTISNIGINVCACHYAESALTHTKTVQRVRDCKVVPTFSNWKMATLLLSDKTLRQLLRPGCPKVQVVGRTRGSSSFPEGHLFWLSPTYLASFRTTRDSAVSRGVTE